MEAVCLGAPNSLPFIKTQTKQAILLSDSAVWYQILDINYFLILLTSCDFHSYKLFFLLFLYLVPSSLCSYQYRGALELNQQVPFFFVGI